MCQGFLYLFAHHTSPSSLPCEHSDHIFSTFLDHKKKKGNDNSKIEQGADATETAEALDNWQKLGGPVLIGVETS